MAADNVASMIFDPVTASASRTYVVPLLAGGIYVLADKYLEQDYGKSWMYKFLHTAGSSAAASYASEPLRQALKL